MTEVFSGHKSTRTRFERWFTEIEEENKCAGVCSTAYHNPADPDSTTSLFYLFSNVNNGTPKDSCKEPIKESVLKTAKFYLIVMYTMSGFSFVALATISGVLMNDCIKWCRKKRETDSKQRAKNRMVVGDDFD